MGSSWAAVVTSSWLLLLLAVGFADSSALEDQCAALLDFYRAMSTPSDPWHQSLGWDEAYNSTLSSPGNVVVTSCCTWYGISCNDALDTITSLQLSNNNLRGTLLDEDAWVQKLPNMSVIDLSLNAIVGTLPPSFVNFTSLTAFTMEATSISGTLPVAWRAFKSLKTLSLSYNKLSGSIPDAYSEISTLRWMYLGHNELSGTVPKLRVCALLLCGNHRIKGVLDEFDWSSYSGMGGTCSGGVALYLVGTGVSGNIPCIPNVTVLDLSYSMDVSGTIPCCSQLAYLAIEGCSNVVGWSAEPDVCVSPSLSTLCVSFTGVHSLPSNFVERFPVLEIFTARELLIHQELPQLPHTLRVLDVAGNALRAPSHALSAGGPIINISASGFQYMDLTTTSTEGMTLLDTRFACMDATTGAPSTDRCAVRMDVFKAIGLKAFEEVNPSSGEVNTSALGVLTLQGVPTPMIMLFPDLRVGFHVILTFMERWISAMYRPRLMADHLLPHVELLDESIADSSLSTIRSLPLPWNDSYTAILPSPSGYVLFDALKKSKSVLLFGVVYRLDVTFTYQPVRLPSGLLGVYSKDLSAGELEAPACIPATLFAVPLTTVCTGCPALARCDGTSLLRANGPVWRSKVSYLPFYQCENNGCRSPNGTRRLGTECAPGFGGPLCSLCTPGHGLDTTGNCVSCSDDGWNWTILLFGGLALVGAATFVALKGVPEVSGNVHSVAFNEQLQKEKSTTHVNVIDDEDDEEKVLAAEQAAEEEQSKSEAEHKIRLAKKAAVVIKMIQSHLGVFAAIGQTVYARDRSSTSVAIQTIQQFASQVSLRSISFVTCLFPNFTAITQFQFLLIVVPVLILLELLIIRWCRKRWALIAVASSVMLLLYESTISITLQLIPTDSLTFYDAAQFTVNTTGAVPLEVINTLSLDRRVTMDGSSRGWQTTAYVWLFAFGVGFPVAVVVCYLRMTRQYGPQYAKDNLGFLTSNFRTKRWYWEEAIMLRKFSLVVGVTALRNYPLAQVQAVIAGLMIYMVGLEWQVPFSSSWLHHAERVSCYSGLIVANVLMAKGSLRSVDEETESYQQEEYTSFAVAMQILSFLGICILMFMEWRRASALGIVSSAAKDGDQTRSSVFPINLDMLNFDGSYFKGFNLSRVTQYFSGPTNDAQELTTHGGAGGAGDAASPESVKDLL